MQAATRLVAEKLDMESKHQLRPGPADLHLLVGSCRLEGIAFVYDRLSMRTLLHFCDLYPIDISHLSFNFLCLLLL
jgi:hypothetical protein